MTVDQVMEAVIDYLNDSGWMVFIMAGTIMYLAMWVFESFTTKRRNNNDPD